MYYKLNLVNKKITNGRKMNNNLSACVLVRFEPAFETPEVLAAFLDEFFEVTAVNYADDGREEYVGYAGEGFDPSSLEKAAALAGVVLPAYRVEKLPAVNWLTENVIKFDPIETNDFCIYGVHEKQPPETEKIKLRIYAATAFGSGHQTTKSCLRALEDLKKNGVVCRKILDMGTGSGILTLAAVCLWQNERPLITAVDIDDEAVRVAMQNAFDNQLEKYVTVAQSDGYNSDIIRQNAPYDLIVANILARPLIEMAPSLAAYLAIGGRCILSGFIDNQTDWVVEAHRTAGLELVKIYEDDNWRAALMEKK